MDTPDCAQILLLVLCSENTSGRAEEAINSVWNKKKLVGYLQGNSPTTVIQLWPDTEPF